MKEIRLYRPLETFNKNCSYTILIGKQKLTELKNGEETTIKISEELVGRTLQTKIQWCGSKRLKLTDKLENKKIKVKGHKFLNGRLPLLGAIFPLVGIVVFGNNNIIAKNIGIGILLLLFTLLVGILTVGRNKWLIMEIE